VQSVHYAEPSLDPPGQRTALSRLPFEETLARLREAIQAVDLWIIHEIDPQALLKRGGFAILSTRQVLFFHPRYLVRLLERDPSALVEVPLKLVVMEQPDGTVVLRHPDAASAFSRYAGLEELGAEFSALYRRLLAEVAG
jgi:uncharacterized protein (DUF302 family)